MTEKGCGCLGVSAAVAIGIVAGVVGLAVAGYFWTDKKILSDRPAEFQKQKWTAVDEAALALKMAPAARAVSQHKQSSFKLSLKPEEADYLLGQYVFNQPDDSRVHLSLGDTVMIVDFSKKVMDGKFINGDMRAALTGKDGDFEVKVYALRTGEFQWPRTFLPEAGQWLEGMLETQTLFKDDPWRLKSIGHDGKKIQAEIEVKGGGG